MSIRTIDIENLDNFLKIEINNLVNILELDKDFLVNSIDNWLSKI